MRLVRVCPLVPDIRCDSTSLVGVAQFHARYQLVLGQVSRMILPGQGHCPVVLSSNEEEGTGTVQGLKLFLMVCFRPATTADPAVHLCPRCQAAGTSLALS